MGVIRQKVAVKKHYSPMITLKRPETTLKWRYCRAYQGSPELEVLDTALERPP